MGTPAFSYYMHDGPWAFSFELAGIWAAEGAKRVEQDWQSASEVIGRKEFVVDLAFLAATIVADTPKSRALTESIIGRAVPSTTRIANTCSPYRSASFSINGEPGKQKGSDGWKPKTMIW
jgi:hypothetical protein